MSKIGKLPVPVPKGVTVTIKPREVSVKGPKGTLTRAIPMTVRVRQDGEEVFVERADMSRESAITYGTIRAHLANMVKGVTEGFQKVLVMEGVGYRGQGSKKGVTLSLGFSHPIEYAAPAGILIETPEPTRIVISGIDIERVGQVAAELRKYRKPEPYKGKGIRYEGEKIRRKAGKAAGK